MIKNLIKVANSLDSKGFAKEADELDRIIRKLAQQAVIVNYTVLPGDTLGEITAAHSAPVGKTLEDNMKLNPGLVPTRMQVGQTISIWAGPEYEGGVHP